MERLPQGVGCLQCDDVREQVAITSAWGKKKGGALQHNADTEEGVVGKEGGCPAAQCRHRRRCGW
jgi:hypothetical protein